MSIVIILFLSFHGNFEVECRCEKAITAKGEEWCDGECAPAGSSSPGDYYCHSAYDDDNVHSCICVYERDDRHVKARIVIFMLCYIALIIHFLEKGKNLFLIQC